MIGFAPDPRTLSNLYEYVCVAEYLIGRKLTPDEIEKATEWRADKLSPCALADYLNLSASSPSTPIPPGTERSPRPDRHSRPGDPLLTEMEQFL